MTLRLAHLQIRTRLTLAYTVVAMLLMVALGTILYGALSLQLNDAADSELKLHASGIAQYLQENVGPGANAEVFAELGENAELNASTDLVQIEDAAGRVLFRSKAAEKFSFPATQAAPFSDLRVGHRSYRLLRREVVAAEPCTLLLANDRTEYAEALDQLRQLLFLGIPIALVVSFLAGLWMSAGALRPLHTIASTVHAIDSRRLAVRLPITGSGDELDRLSATLNSLFDRLQQSFERIGRFTADASHELRTPLALIRGNAEIMRSETALAPKADARAVDILAEADRMQTLIANLLELARSDQASPLNFELLDPAELTARAELVGRSLVAGSLAAGPGVTGPGAAGKQLHLDVVPPGTIYPLVGDDTALSRVLVILLDNAVRNTGDGGSVRLVVTSAASGCTFEVQDTGVGIDARHLPHVFDRFYRVDEARTRSVGGTGLGLSIAQSIVAAHRGSIAVESAPGKGSTFRVTIPATQSQLET
jgi:signal transduction histidine kinase